MVLDKTILQTVAWRPAPGNEVTMKCPFCGAREGHFYLNLEKNCFYCHRCGAKGTLGEEVAKPVTRQRAKPSQPENIATPDELHEAYSYLLSCLRLSNEHLRHLTSPLRGLTEAQLRANGYKTLPSREALREQVATKCAQLFDLSKIPGFYRTDEGRWSIAGPSGILIPCRSFEGKITGIQIRADNPTHGKYVWLSSNGRTDGQSSGVHLHVAAPPNASSTTCCWVTEGPLKADIASIRLMETVVAVPGIQSWRKVRLIEELKAHGYKTVIVAFDSEDNPHTEVSTKKLLQVLVQNGFETYRATWPKDFKGLDDLLIAGHLPELKLMPRRHQLMNKVLISGILRKIDVANFTPKNGKEAVKKATIVVALPRQNDKSENIPVTFWNHAAENLESQEPRKGDWIEVEGRIKLGTSAYGETVITLQGDRATIIKQDTWSEEEAPAPDADAEAEQ